MAMGSVVVVGVLQERISQKRDYNFLVEDPVPLNASLHCHIGPMEGQQYPLLHLLTLCPISLSAARVL